MEKLEIKGGKKVSGTVEISGSKKMCNLKQDTWFVFN